MRDIVDQLTDAALIAILRSDAPFDAAAVGDALYAGGVRAMEITLNSRHPFDAILHARRWSEGCPGTLVGAGTVLSSEDASRAADAGAQFLITPIFDPAVLARAAELDLPTVCGCFSPTECWNAYRSGASLIKLFPAHLLGPGYVRELRAPLPMLNIIATGGIRKDNVCDYLRAGCVGVAMGTGLVGDISMADYAFITSQARAITERIGEFRKTEARS